jgi:hypothetical protein
MKYQEKKYRVDSFTKIQNVLNENNAKKGQENITIHYYAQQESNNVVKLVKYNDRNEIHILEESQGKLSLKQNISVPTTDAGLQWLKDKGYKTVDIVKMVNTDYEYKNGIVGLYIIDDFLYSIILDFPEGQHEAIEKKLGLNTTKVISIPYNKLLEKISHLRSMNL